MTQVEKLESVGILDGVRKSYAVNGVIPADCDEKINALSDDACIAAWASCHLTRLVNPQLAILALDIIQRYKELKEAEDGA